METQTVMEIELNDKLEGKAGRSYIYLIAMVAAVGGYMFGFDLAIMGGAMLFLKKAFGLTAGQEGFAMGSATIGCMLAPLLTVALADRLGRKRTMIVTAILFAVSAIGTALPRNMTDFNLYRILTGVAIGISSIVSPMYIAEVAPARIRGRLVTINQLAIVGGSLVAVLVSYFLAKFQVAHEWRWMFASEMVPVLPFFIGVMLIPESPRWLVMKGRREQARGILTLISGRGTAQNEMVQIVEGLQQKQGSFLELFRPGIRVALLIAVGLAFFQQMTGASIMFSYAPSVFQKAGYSAASDAIGVTFILMIWNVIVTIASMYCVERFGRRKLLMIGAIGMAIGMFATGWVFYRNLSGIIVLLALFVAIGSYVFSIASLAWVIMAEIFPTHIRGKAMSIGALTVWVCCFGALWIYPLLSKWFETRYGSIAGAFWVFAGVSLLSFVFSWALVPETKGRTLEEIGKFWTRDRDQH